MSPVIRLGDSTLGPSEQHPLPHPLTTLLSLFLSRVSTANCSRSISQLQVTTSLKWKITSDRLQTNLFSFLCVCLSENRDALFLHRLIFLGSRGGQVEPQLRLLL